MKKAPHNLLAGGEISFDKEPASKKPKVSPTDNVISKTRENLAAEEAIKLSLCWLSTPKDLLAVSAVNPYFHMEVAKLNEARGSILARLDKSLALQERKIVTYSFYPREFVDPRLCPGYINLSSYKKSMDLGQYKFIVLEYLQAPMDEDDEACLQALQEEFGQLFARRIGMNTLIPKVMAKEV